MKPGIRILIAVLVMVVMQVADYFITNSTYPVFDSISTQMAFDYVDRKGEAPDSNIMYVNVGLDKDLVPFTDEFGDTIGKVAVTDRKLLAEFLNLIKDSGYKYIYLDIRFEEGTRSNNDSLLFSLLEEMPRLTFSTHRDMETIVPPELDRKSAYSDYRGFHRNGFTRYEYLQDGKESAALRMYREIYGDSLYQKGPAFFMGKNLSYNMLFIPFYTNDTSDLGEEGKIKFPYLSSHLLKNYTAEEIRQMAKGKIVVIGDFVNDIHNTYIGNVPGPVLAVRAFQVLEKGSNRFSWVAFSIISAVYILILYFLLGDYNLNEQICRLIKIKSNLLAYLLSLIGWGLVLGGIKLALYAIFGIAFVAFIPAFVFSTVSFVKGYLKFNRSNEK